MNAAEIARVFARRIADRRPDLWDDLEQEGLLHLWLVADRLRGLALRESLRRHVERAYVALLAGGIVGGAGAGRHLRISEARRRQAVPLESWGAIDPDTPELLAARLESVRRVRAARRWLSARERAIFDQRLVAEDPVRLEDVRLPGRRFSRETARQVEAGAMARLRAIFGARPQVVSGVECRNGHPQTQATRYIYAGGRKSECSRCKRARRSTA